jgi:hypothetical protein
MAASARSERTERAPLHASFLRDGCRICRDIRLARHVHQPVATQISEILMADDRIDSEPDTTLDPEDVNSPPSSAAAADESRGADGSDANDEVPVPIAMSPAEVDERAQAVEALRGTTAPLPMEDPGLSA